MSISADMYKLFETGMPFAARTEIKAVKLDKDNIELLMPLAPNINHVGIMYAGALFTLGEMMGGAVALVYLFEHSLIPIVKSFSIKFVKPGTTDITTSYVMTEEEVKRIIAECEEKGKADYSIQLELKDKTGLVVAVTDGLYQVRPQKK
ncbi:MAG: YiiD C-terminal domain-containing protein [Deltaproteobacteria bacterium]|nr:MAG: YiiD C-terminal domain-containing protein [Deltaproteobacteria bacterium]